MADSTDETQGLAAKWHCFADELQGKPVPGRFMTERQEAADRLVDHSNLRLAAIRDSRPGDDYHLMLSGGVDSMFLAGACKTQGIMPTAWTVSVGEAGQDEAEAAAELAGHLGIRHIVVTLSDNRVVELAESVISALGVDELWEVCAAIPIVAAVEAISSAAVAAPVILTGGGADACLGGGYRPTNPAGSRALRLELERVIHQKVVDSFTEDRLVPYFHDKILGRSSDNFYEFFQTKQFWDLTKTWGDEALFGVGPAGQMADKVCLRDAATSVGVPDQLVWRPKSPLQYSSGMVACLGRIARQSALAWPGAAEYSDPLVESAEAVLARFALRGIGQAASS